MRNETKNVISSAGSRYAATPNGGTVELFGRQRLGKAVVEATKAGIEMWQDYSVEYAYKVYLDQNVANDGTVSNDSWDIIFYNMGSGLDFMQREYRTAYAAANGMTVKEIEADKSLKNRLDGMVVNVVKQSFMSRYTNSNAVEAEKARIKETLASFDKYGLLSWSKLYGFPDDMKLTNRIDPLMKIRVNILNMVGGDRSGFGVDDEDITNSLAFDRRLPIPRPCKAAIQEVRGWLAFQSGVILLRYWPLHRKTRKAPSAACGY